MSPEFLAGFFDGEGCIDCQRMYPKQGRARFYVRPRVRVAQASSGRVILDKLKEQFGGTILERKRQKATQQASASWEFLDNEGIRTLLMVIEPHLIIKREQARLVLWWLEHASGRHGRNGQRPNIEAARKLFADELKAMKLDPQRLSERAVAAIEPLMR